MTTQINLKFQDNFFKLTKEYALAKGYLNVQELVRDALREKIYGDLEMKTKYKQILKSKQANKFISDEKSSELDKILKQQAKIE